MAKKTLSAKAPAKMSSPTVKTPTPADDDETLKMLAIMLGVSFAFFGFLVWWNKPVEYPVVKGFPPPFDPRYGYQWITTPDDVQTGVVYMRKPIMDRFANLKDGAAAERAKDPNSEKGKQMRGYVMCFSRWVDALSVSSNDRVSFGPHSGRDPFKCKFEVIPPLAYANVKIVEPCFGKKAPC